MWKHLQCCWFAAGNNQGSNAPSVAEIHPLLIILLALGMIFTIARFSKNNLQIRNLVFTDFFAKPLFVKIRILQLLSLLFFY